MAFASSIPLIPSFDKHYHCSRQRKRASITCSNTELPSSYTAARDFASAAIRSAIAHRIQLLEVQLPVVPNEGTAALNELHDSTRSFARELARKLPPPFAMFFPDAAEAALARRVWGETPFGVYALSDAQKFQKLPALVIAVSPGFNVSEWIQLENLQSAEKGVVVLNGDLDKVRTGYYPRLFYPGLWKAKERYLTKFEPVYYVKRLAKGGTLARTYPSKWRLFYRKRGGETEVIMECDERPTFEDVEKALTKRREREIMEVRGTA